MADPPSFRVGDPIPEHESPVRRIVTDAEGVPYKAYKTLAEARADPDGAVVLESDDGGQILATAPASLIACSEEDLRLLLKDLDSIAWDVNEGQGAMVVFERRSRNSGVAGGMGGGVLIDRPWVHQEFRVLGLEQSIGDVMRGLIDRIPRISRYEMALRYWKGGLPNGIGALIVDDLPARERPQWAADVLEYMIRFSTQDLTEARELIELARNPSLWQASFIVLSRLEGKAKESKDRARWLLVEVASVVADSADYPNPRGSSAGRLIPRELHAMSAPSAILYLMKRGES